MRKNSVFAMPVVRNAIRELWISGVTQAEIVARLGVSAKVIAEVLRPEEERPVEVLRILPVEPS